MVAGEATISLRHLPVSPLSLISSCCWHHGWSREWKGKWKKWYSCSPSASFLLPVEEVISPECFEVPVTGHTSRKLFLLPCSGEDHIISMERFAFPLWPDVHWCPERAVSLLVLKRLSCCAVKAELFTLCCLLCLNYRKCKSSAYSSCKLVKYVLSPLELFLLGELISMSVMLEHNTGICQHCEMLNSTWWHFWNQAWRCSRTSAACTLF